ncbi:MAG: type VII secretion integral membrane protein EccD [Mycobacterium sp.]
MSVRRVCVHVERRDGPVAIDVSLPAGLPVVDLIPAVVDLVDDYQSSSEATAWRLGRPTGSALEESMSLEDNGVRDGDLLVLGPNHIAPPSPIRGEPCQAVADASTGGSERTRLLADAVGALATVLGAAALAGTGVSDHPGPNLIVAAGGACAAIVAALARGHSVALGVAAVALGAATGYLAVPSGPSAANAFLAATAALSVALLLMRVTGRASSTLAAAIALSALLAVVTVAAMPTAVVGALLATASLGLLAFAPRITVLAAGLGPAHWASGVTDRADAAHAILSGLVAACAIGTASGVGAVAVAGLSGAVTPLAALAFSAVTSAVLLLRARTYVDAGRRIALVAAGSATVAIAVTLVVVAQPRLSGWCCGMLVAVGLAVAVRPRIGAAVTRVVDRLEYVALAAVVPLACWVGGGYALVAQVHLS